MKMQFYAHFTTTKETHIIIMLFRLCMYLIEKTLLNLLSKVHGIIRTELAKQLYAVIQKSP